MRTEKPAGYAIIDSEGWFVVVKGDVNAQYELKLSSVPEEPINQAAAEVRFNRIMENTARHKDQLHFPIKVIPLFQRHITTTKDAKQ
jgi:hypothetical protein